MKAGADQTMAHPDPAASTTTPLNRFPFVAAACFLLVASPFLWAGEAAAQKGFPSTVEIWGGVAAWSGENAKGFEPGAGTGSSFFFDVGWPIQLGGDLAFNRFETDQSVGKVDEFSGAAAARYRFLQDGAVIPFLGIRAGYTRLSADLADFRFEQNGGLVGGSTGVEIPLRGRIMLALTGEALYYHYADTKIFLEDEEIPSSGGGGWRYWGRIGLSWRWGPSWEG
jgi:opacity protein-like surface antigen